MGINKMANRVTTRDLFVAVDRINGQLEDEALPTITLRNGYGFWDITDETTGSNITPLMSKREVLMWLEGFEKAIDIMQRG